MAAEVGFAENRTGSAENIGRTVKRNVWSAIDTLILHHGMRDRFVRAVVSVSDCSDSRRSDAPRLSFLLKTNEKTDKRKGYTQ
jgi:hypothetical protein